MMLFPQDAKIKPNARDITQEYIERMDNVTVNDVAVRNIKSYEPKNRDEWDRINDWQDYPAERKLDFK